MPYDDPDASPDDHAPRAEAPARDKQRSDDRGREGQPSQGGDKQDEQKAKKRRPLLWLIFALVVLAAAVGGVIWWFATKNLQSTDDAYTDGNAVIIAPKISGYVREMAINDNQFVHKGDLLIKLGARDYLASRDVARAQVEAAQGQLDAAKVNAQLVRLTAPAKLQAAQAQKQSAQATLTQRAADYRRQTSVSKAATTQQSIDLATSDQKQAQASVAEADANIAQAAPVDQLVAQADAQVEQLQGQLDVAKAQLESAEVNLGYATITAPQDGWVTKRNVNLGNYVSAGSQVMSLVTTDLWVTANFKETELTRMRRGQDVDIAVDAYPSLKLKGTVDSIQLGSGSKFTAFPAENATGNYVKIVQRIPVKITIASGLDPNLPLSLGLSVEPTVKLK